MLEVPRDTDSRLQTEPRALRPGAPPPRTDAQGLRSRAPGLGWAGPGSFLLSRPEQKLPLKTQAPNTLKSQHPSRRGVLLVFNQMTLNL